jgi:hypothetical protein
VGFEVVLEGGGEIEPGQVIEVGVAVTNTSAVVDEVQLSVLGDGAGWVTVHPASIALFPGTAAQAALRIAPQIDGAPAAVPMALADYLESSYAYGGPGSSGVVAVLEQVVDLSSCSLSDPTAADRGGATTMLEIGAAPCPVPAAATAAIYQARFTRDAAGSESDGSYDNAYLHVA